MRLKTLCENTLDVKDMNGASGPREDRLDVAWTCSWRDIGEELQNLNAMGPVTTPAAVPKSCSTNCFFD